MLHKAALHLIAIQPATAKQELDFNAARDLLRPKRSLLSPWLVEVLLFLKHNRHLSDKELKHIKEVDNDGAVNSLPERLSKAAMYVRKTRNPTNPFYVDLGEEPPEPREKVKINTNSNSIDPDSDSDQDSEDED